MKLTSSRRLQEAAGWELRQAAGGCWLQRVSCLHLHFAFWPDEFPNSLAIHATITACCNLQPASPHLNQINDRYEFFDELFVQPQSVCLFHSQRVPNLPYSLTADARKSFLST